MREKIPTEKPFEKTKRSTPKRRRVVADEEREGEIEKKEGVASIALLPCGSISGHFIHTPLSVCYGLHGTAASKKEQTVVVECKGHDAARINNVEHAHGWEEDVIGLVEQKHRKKKVSVSFECETLKADKAAEDHIRQFMPKLSGLDAVINIGPMKISGLDFAVVEEEHAN
ncbi:hypothetical protein HID58_076936 [Brassica napus]|uniref:Uncharacterized protein n=1 Tax=Brassica napus TaxID=3708 RepID=A0ABQ7YNY2_BRANA|nr:hypothetical protein HID58_076936 [Brassica napus]